MKTCVRCKKEHPEDFFYKVRPSTCMACWRKSSKEGRIKSAETGWLKEYSKKRYLKNREKALARSKARNAVKAGKLIKPTQCEGCNLEERLQAHHEDYSKPLEVNWLCDPCHKDKHGRLVDRRLIGANHEI